MALALAAIAFRPASTAGPALRDFESYYGAGSAWNAGDDPYTRDLWRAERKIPGVDASREELLPFVGPPFALPLWSLVARVPWEAAVVLWSCVLALAAATLVLGALALGGRHVTVLDALAALLAGASFGPLTSGLALGQVAVVSCAGVVAVLLLLRARPRGGAFAAAAAAAGAALQPNLALPLAGRLGDRRAAIAFALAAALVVGGSLVALGGRAAAYVDVVRAHAFAERFLAIQTTAGAVARSLGASAAWADAGAVALAALTAALVLVQWLSHRYAPVERVALACAALPLAQPFAHEHDFAIVLLPAFLCVRRARGAVWFAATIGTLAVAVDWLGLAQRPTGLMQAALLAAACALALGALGARELGPLRFAPALGAFVVLAAGAGLAGHALPVWPDALGATFRPPHELTAAEVWAREQRDSGIATLDPRFGLLRLCSLAGCAGLWAAASAALRRR